MSETSRRKFIAAAGVSGAAAAGLVALGTTSASAQPGARAAREPVLAVIDDHRSGVVRLLVGEREVVVHDHDLATRILNAAGGK